ncbi:hypothetical protein BLNAU_20425 [Blattamonas nauphoetae]|uniref:Uncharacterized protein n=1 Tax=Blattamonas nauphoetae TaxID=2049346 RepID=A0ABQ9WYM7_9EUKA|nr:hypothetical protein BLNAU_24268 [Blattamonas nauphoetae]KAK2943695.1 hypothetical protein BLNAU_21398 [Blattamonas nauphoetae]KAK2944626.1 hypothetical protein BLNAU_20425 [Blattamonas nauphoetae]
MPYPTNHPYEQTKQGTAIEEEPELNQIVIQNIVEKIFETESTKLTKRLARNMNHFPCILSEDIAGKPILLT